MAVILLAGCGHNIGDPCKTNVDCSPLGDRFCDISSVNGYCTIENCGVSSCPSEAVCVRFFTPVAEEACTVDSDVTEPLSRGSCSRVEDRCVCDQTADNGSCASMNGHCAPSASERRWCERKCSSNSDCRSGYECRRTGSLGAEAVPTFDMGAGEPAKFCAPSGSTS